MATVKWSQFFNFSSIDKNRVNGLCKLYHKNYKDRNGTYSNFIKHMKRMHCIEYEQISSSDALSEETNVVIDDRATTDLSNTYIKSRQNEFVLSITKNLIIKCGLPLNFVERASFCEF